MKKKQSRTRFIPILLLLIPILTVIYAGIKYFTKEEHTVYARVKMSQGLWWASTAKPNLWLAKSIQKGDKEVSFLGRTLAEITEVRYYPYISRNSDSVSEDRYNVYLKVRLSVGKDSKGNFIYNRSNLIVGSPIEIETGKTQITGTVTEISESDFDDNYETKKVTLLKTMGYTKANPYPYTEIKEGSIYFDGTENVVEIIDKSLRGVSIYISDDNGQIREYTSGITQNILVTANLKVRRIGEEYVFGEEKTLRKGSELYIPTNSYSFEEYIVTSIE